MPVNESNASQSEFSRRDVLRAGAGAIALAPLSHATGEGAEDPFRVKPYLQLGDTPRLLKAEQMVVTWHTAVDDATWGIEFRNSTAGEWVAASDPKITRVAASGIKPHSVLRSTLKGLTPGTDFQYRLSRSGKVVFASHGRARKSKSQPVRCVVMGDCGTGSPQQKQVAFQAARVDPDFVLIPGDLVYSNGRISEYESSFWPAYSPDKATPQSGAPLLRSVPFFGGLGQHDTGATLDDYADGFAYYMYWSFPLNGPVRDEGSANAFPLGNNQQRRAAAFTATEDRYPCMANYSFDYGNTHWTVLDTWNPHINWNDPKLREWLRKDLESSRATWKFVSSYLPPFNSSTAYPHTQKMRVIVDILQETGVDIVFCGYAHSYQVTRPLRFTPTSKPTGPVRAAGYEIPGSFEFDTSFDGKRRTKPKGVVYITTGGGGNASLHSPEQTDNPKTWQPFTVKYNASVNQFTDLRINDDQLVLRQVDLKGNLIDEFRVSK